MRYVENSNLLFDKIDGRFVSSEMEGSYNKEDIKQFYSSVLPNLGWKKVDENLYLRDGEYLEIKLNSVYWRILYSRCFTYRRISVRRPVFCRDCGCF